MKTQREDEGLEAKKRASEETHPPDDLILNSSLRNCEKISFCCFSHLVYETLLRQLEQTNTASSIEKAILLGNVSCLLFLSHTGKINKLDKGDFSRHR